MSFIIGNDRPGGALRLRLPRFWSRTHHQRGILHVVHTPCIVPCRIYDIHVARHDKHMAWAISSERVSLRLVWAVEVGLIVAARAHSTRRQAKFSKGIFSANFAHISSRPCRNLPMRDTRLKQLGERRSARWLHFMFWPKIWGFSKFCIFSIDCHNKTCKNSIFIRM